jgi:hypothetical protein
VLGQIGGTLADASIRFVAISKEESRPELESLREVQNHHDVNMAKVFVEYRSKVK